MVATEKFEQLTRLAARSYGLSELRMVVGGHPLGTAPEASLQSWAEASVEPVVAAFAGRGS